MFKRVFNRFGILVFRSVEPGVSLVFVRIFRRVVVAFSPRNRWIEIVRCEGDIA